MIQTPENILKTYWGYDRFRPSQLEVIQAILDKNDVLTLMPTGGGKSICFQVPALMMEGICIVVTPLIALMQDQIDNLAGKGIKALSIYSGMSAREIDFTLDNAIYGDYSFLYVSPERLQTQLFKERFKKMKVSFIAVDEAHCISQWGYDFRPSYLKIAALKDIKEQVSIVALTASATPKVAIDIQAKLKLSDSKVFKTTFKRDNLNYITLKTNNKLDDTISTATKLKGSGIIYCQTRKATKQLYQHLYAQNVSADFYHGGLDNKTRTEKQQKWIDNQTRIIIATNAFGMGIDKPDVRFVIHFDVPETIEHYYQEAGRAGRDQKAAKAILFFDDTDINSLQEKIDLRFPDINTVKSIYTALGNHFQLAIGSGKDETFNLDFKAFVSKYNLNIYKAYNAIKILENSGFIKFNDFQFMLSKLKILVDKTALYQYQVRNAEHNKVIQFILRSHFGVFDDYIKIDETIIAKKIGITTTSKTINTLNYLKDHQVVDYTPRTKGYQIIFLIERLDNQNFRIPSEFYKTRKKVAVENVNTMTSFLNLSVCRQSFLLEYFGETDAVDCGKCNVCVRTKTKVPSEELTQQLNTYLNHSVQNQKHIEIKEVIKYFIQYDPEIVLTTLKWMNENEQIQIDKTGRFIHF